MTITKHQGNGEGGTFEDRLLSQLTDEVVSGVDERPLAPRGRRVTAGRAAVGLAACAAVGGAVVVTPGSPTESDAYAVEKKENGSIELTIDDLTMDRDEQRALKSDLADWGIDTKMVNPPPGTTCSDDRGVPELDKVGYSKVKGKGGLTGISYETDDGAVLRGGSEPGEDHRDPANMTLESGTTLIIENWQDKKGDATWAQFINVKGAPDTCDPIPF